MQPLLFFMPIAYIYLYMFSKCLPLSPSFSLCFFIHIAFSILNSPSLSFRECNLSLYQGSPNGPNISNQLGRNGPNPSLKQSWVRMYFIARISYCFRRAHESFVSFIFISLFGLVIFGPIGPYFESLLFIFGIYDFRPHGSGP